jgi:tellurite resistance protein TerC
MLSSAEPLDWAVFAATVVLTLAIDSFVMGRSSGSRVSFRSATIRSLFAIGVALCFAGYVWARMGGEKAITYVVAYLVEESLSVDNLFVFLVIFSYFGVPEKHQQKTLFWGIFGAVVMRLVFVLAGSALLHRFTWMMYVFGAFLVFTGLKLAFKKEDDSMDPESSLALRIARKFLRTTKEYDGDKFFTMKDGVRHATPLFLVLIVIEFTDVVFAVDSVPAVLAISPDLFIVYTSNIFAILGLRSLYFMLAGMMSRFHYLDLGLAVILVFIGTKMLGSKWVHLPSFVSLGVIAGVLAIAIIASLLRAPNEPEEAPPKTDQRPMIPFPELAKETDEKKDALPPLALADEAPKSDREPDRKAE